MYDMSQSASTMPPCENCGGQQVGNLDVVSQQAVGIHPTGRALWSRPLSPLAAVVCLNCGLTKLFASDLEAIRKEAQNKPHDFTW